MPPRSLAKIADLLKIFGRFVLVYILFDNGNYSLALLEVIKTLEIILKMIKSK